MKFDSKRKKKSILKCCCRHRDFEWTSILVRRSQINASLQQVHSCDVSEGTSRLMLTVARVPYVCLFESLCFNFSSFDRKGPVCVDLVVQPKGVFAFFNSCYFSK